MGSSQRLAAILFTDIAGFTSLMGSNEEESMKLLQINRSIHISQINIFGGTYVKEIGDGTLAHFGSVYEAVKCAISIQEIARKELNASLRMGIHLGEITFENNDVFGAGVNIASRIEPLSEPGGICITEAVAKALGSYPDIRTVFLGKAKLKNVNFPVKVYGITGYSLSVPTRKKFNKRMRQSKPVPSRLTTILVYLGIPLLIAFVVLEKYEQKYEVADARASMDVLTRMMDSSWRDYSNAYHMAKEIQKKIPGDSVLKGLIKQSSLKININTDPEGARIYVKEYKNPDQEWEYLGESPLKDIELPITVFRWKLEKDGYNTIYAAASDWDVAIKMGSLLVPCDFSRKLDPVGSIPDGMVRIPGAQTRLGRINDFFIDQYEVTNKQYKTFMNQGGYKNRKYWLYEFERNGQRMSWEEAMKLFTDQTGRLGPANWQGADYPAGRDDYPVSGISWFEAAAYADFAGKELPSGTHWGLAMGETTPLIKWPQFGGYAIFSPFSNFRGEGPVSVGKLRGVSPYGVYDMAGNVREWCQNETPGGRLIRGGAWDDATYLFTALSQESPFDRSGKNGFRCAIYPDKENIPARVFTMTRFNEFQYYTGKKPVPDEIFKAYKEQFSYDKSELDAKIDSRNDSSDDWTYERISFNAAYNNERIIGHLFLPKNTSPPYQTVIYFPGGATYLFASSNDIEHYDEFLNFVSFIIKNGRAVLFPVYKGTFERRENGLNALVLIQQGKLRRFTELRVQLIKDFKRCIDYLDSRQDIDTARLAYYGLSQGAMMGAIIPAVEDRIKTSVLISGGYVDFGLPEVNQINYITRVKIPTLMLNGKYDMLMPYDKSIIPMFNLLGTRDEDKELKLYETDHIPPRREFIKESLAWFDRYLGPVR